MEKTPQIFLILSSSIVLFLTIPGQTADLCKPDSCHATRGPKIRFPFRLKGRQLPRCGYPGFDLHCNARNQTILSLPRSGEFIVDYIDYKASALFIDDPGFCLSNRALNFSLSGSSFEATHLNSFGILNCSDDLTTDDMPMDYYVVLPCLSTANNTVAAVDVDFPAEMVPPPCRREANISVPPWYSDFYWGSIGSKEDFELRWSQPACGRCERRGGLCGFTKDSGLETGCSKSSVTGLPRGAKYAVIIGVGIPGLLGMIALTCYTCNKIRMVRHQRRRLNNELPTISFDRQSMVRATSGLELPTIESYPKTVLGQSRRLPNPSNDTCSICLSDYQPKETLKSIPECNHYFHASCIDEWLKLNGTCPLCRNSPEISSLVTPSSSSSSSSPSSTTSNHHY
ncbi:hypothetical protein C2S52_020765 [Perilla frutescens var. hirtella]|nr:hypothetical protein C2S52_020765 [Perilla frutescens var. hirtella]KAH6805116.1 hypothetical protein C2S51_029947 [Perilla frutescens var. frutescens]